MAIYVTVVAPQRTIDMEIAADRQVGALVEQLLAIFGIWPASSTKGQATEWALGTLNGLPFPRDLALEACDVADGAILKLQKTHAWNERQAPNIREITPSLATQGMGVRFRRDDEPEHLAEPAQRRKERR